MFFKAYNGFHDILNISLNKFQTKLPEVKFYQHLHIRTSHKHIHCVIVSISLHSLVHKSYFPVRPGWGSHESGQLVCFHHNLGDSY